MADSRRTSRGEFAETFRGRLALLVIDKLVIGALIAVAIFVYDSIKT